MRSIGPKCKQCRREGEKLFLKGERCSTQKCAIVRRNTAPGKGKKSMTSKLSEFGKQLREKQKTKRIFGITEKVFRNYYQKASSRRGNTGDNILTLLEIRLDNIIYKAGFTSSRNQARQLVSHGFFAINGKRVDIPSISLRPGDKITAYKEFKSNLEQEHRSPSWLKVDFTKKAIEVLSFPEKDELEKSVAVNMIVEFYSR